MKLQSVCCWHLYLMQQLRIFLIFLFQSIEIVQLFVKKPFNFDHVYGVMKNKECALHVLDRYESCFALLFLARLPAAGFV